MPELPEVETIKRDLVKQVLNKEIVEIKVNLLRAFENPHNLNTNGIISDISRIGKYLVLTIDTVLPPPHPSPLTTHSYKLLIHLRMTGKLIYHKTSKGYDEKHVRVVIIFKDGDCLLFHDVRTFGKLEVIPFQASIESIKNLGVDAISDLFTLKYLAKICHSKKTPIKNLLLDQSLIAGIGNIYAQEILFATRISPTRISNTLNKKEIKKIYAFTKEILELAIKHNGTSISDFRRVDDKTGEFQNFLKVYGKKTCCICENDLIKIKQGGRSTTYCEICQC